MANKIGTVEIITIVGLFLGYATALIGAYVNLKVKLKELDVKILNLEGELNAHRSRINNTVDKFEECNTKEHDAIVVKIDTMLEKITELRVNQASDSASAHVAAAAAAAAAVAAVAKSRTPKPKES